MEIKIDRLFKLALGAGSKGVVSGFLSGLTPMPGVTPDILTAFVGFFMARQGGNWLGPLGEGMLIASIGQMIKEPIENFAGKLKGGGTTSSSSSSSSSSNPGGNGHKEPLSLAEYNAQQGR